MLLGEATEEFQFITMWIGLFFIQYDNALVPKAAEEDNRRVLQE